MNLKDRIKSLRESPIVSAALNRISDPEQRLEAETAISRMIDEALEAFGPIGHFEVSEVPSHAAAPYIGKEGTTAPQDPDAK